MSEHVWVAIDFKHVFCAGKCLYWTVVPLPKNKYFKWVESEGAVLIYECFYTGRICSLFEDIF